MEDGTTKIFLNTKGKNPESVSKELVNFLQYVENTTEQCVEELQDKTLDRLHNRVQALKKSRDWESRYMRFDELLQNAEKVGLARGMEKGMEKGQARLLSLIDKMNEAGESEHIRRLANDADFLQEMYEKYQV